MHSSRITVVTMAGAVIAIDDAAAVDTILSVKRRVFAANDKLFVRRQRIVYMPGPHGMDALADDETLGGAGVARDGTAKLDVLVVDLSAAQAAELGQQVWPCLGSTHWSALCRDVFESVIYSRLHYRPVKAVLIALCDSALKQRSWFCPVLVIFQLIFCCLPRFNETSWWMLCKVAVRAMLLRWWQRAPTWITKKTRHTACFF